MSSLAIRKSISLFSIPELLLLLVAIVWGTSYGLTKSAIAYTTVSIFIAIRFGWTFLLLLPVMIRDFVHGKNRDWPVALPTGVILAAIFFFEVYGVSLTTASNAAFLISLNVIFTLLLETLIGRRKPNRALMWLSLFSTIGVVMLTNKQGLSMTFNLGDIYILCAAALRAVMVIVTKNLTHGKVITNTTLTCIQSLIVALSASLISIVSHEPTHPLLPQALEFWLTTSFLVLFCTLFAFYAQNYAVRKISPTKASLLMGSEPLFGAIFSILWLNEELTSVQWLGAAILLCTVLSASLSKACSEYQVTNSTPSKI
ncbi:DMT family transporter [Vibrio sp. J1-1]|uniref:DMT family transporter n=1 Tax=Vibrio sp. J1-1 TaxID=2912251 RepID=UPI001F3E82FC|nr:DMT family transporter [Vibrio sp. J1-1]